MTDFTVPDALGGVELRHFSLPNGPRYPCRRNGSQSARSRLHIAQVSGDSIECVSKGKMREAYLKDSLFAKSASKGRLPPSSSSNSTYLCPRAT